MYNFDRGLVPRLRQQVRRRAAEKRSEDGNALGNLLRLRENMYGKEKPKMTLRRRRYKMLMGNAAPESDSSDKRGALRRFLGDF